MAPKTPNEGCGEVLQEGYYRRSGFRDFINRNDFK